MSRMLSERSYSVWIDLKRLLLPLYRYHLGWFELELYRWRLAESVQRRRKILHAEHGKVGLDIASTEAFVLTLRGR